MNRILFREYSILCIGKIWVDWPGIDLLIFPRSCFRPSEPGLCFGPIWRGLGIARSPPFLGLGEWDSGPISLPPSVAPQPLCTDCVGKGCNSSCNGCYFHVSTWKRTN